MNEIKDYELVFDNDFKSRFYERTINGIKKFSQKENIEVFEQFYDFIEEYLPFRATSANTRIDLIDLYVIWFAFFKYNRIMLFTDGESLHDICNRLKAQTGEKCFPIFFIYYYHFEKYIFITENGRFFYSDGTYLGKGLEELCQSIFEEKVGIEPYVCNKIFVTLKRQGWYEGRKTDISHIRKEFEEKGKELSPAAEKFFEEFMGVRIKFWFGGYHTRYYEIGHKKNHIRNFDMKYTKIIGEDVICIGDADEYLYYIGKSGNFYIGRSFTTINLGKDPFIFLTWLAFE